MPASTAGSCNIVRLVVAPASFPVLVMAVSDGTPQNGTSDLCSDSIVAGCTGLAAESTWFSQKTSFVTCAYCYALRTPESVVHDTALLGMSSV